MGTIFNDINQILGDIALFNDIIEGADNQTVAMANGGVKPTVSKAVKDHFDAIQAAVQGRLTYETKAAMYAAGAPPAGEIAEVWNDSQSNNGLYGYTGGAWVKSSYDPFTEFGNRLDLSDGAAVATGSMSNQYFDRSVPVSSKAWSNGTIVGKRSITSTFTGWAAPINWDGTEFDCIKIYYNIEFIGKPIRVRVWSADQTTLIAYTTVYSNSGKYNWAVLNKKITTADVPAGIIYLSYDVPDDSARLMPDTVGDYVDVVDPVTYPQKYTTTTGNGEQLTSWTNITSGIGSPPPIELYDLETLFGQDYVDLDLMQDNLTNLQSVFNIAQQIDFTLETKVNDITSTPAYQRRSVDFSGWAILVNKQAGESINAVRVPGYATGISTVADQATTIKVEIRDTSIGGTLIANGSVGIFPGQSKGEIYIPLKDPNTGNLLTLADGDLPATYAVMWMGEKVDGSRAIVGDNRVTVTGYAGNSYYQNIGSGTWVTVTGNPSLGIETVLLSGLAIQDIYTYFGGIDLTRTDLHNDTYNVIAKDLQVGYDTASSQNVVTNPFHRNRAAPFNGWGNDMTPVEGAFNAIRLSFLSRSTPQSETEKWSKIILEVRDGTCPTGILVANGTVDVDKESDLLSNLICLLKDPLTNNRKTLVTEDFPSGMMGITFRAINEAGTNAISGESLGPPSNFAGDSYYTVNGGSSWVDYTSDTPQGIELLFLTNPVEKVIYRIRSTVTTHQAADEAKTVSLIGAPHLYAVEGEEINLYFDNLIYQKDTMYSWDVACSQGEQWDESYRLISSDGSDKALTIQVRDPEDYTNLWGEKDIIIRVAATADGTGVTRKCLFVGDSTSAGGQYVGEVVNLASSDVITLNTIGTRGYAPALHEGRGGWRVGDYASAGRIYFRFDVTGVVTEPRINSTEYSHNGSEYRIQENHLTGGSGYLIAERTSGSTDPLSSGTFTKVLGVGDATIGFNSWSRVSGNPFWNDVTQRVDFSNYMSENGFTMAANDWLFFHLGINDIFGQTKDSGVSDIAKAGAALLDTIIDSAQAYQAGIRIGMMTTIPPAKLQSSFGLNYQSGQTRDRYKRNILIYNQIMVDHFGGREGEGIYLCPVHYTVDPVHGFPGVMQNANSRTTEQVFRMTDSVHPNDSGYYQMADEIFAFLKYWA